MHGKYVLVYANKAANKICKKYYFEVVMREITATTTYESAVKGNSEVISEHLKYIASNHITVKPELRYRHFTGYLS